MQHEWVDTFEGSRQAELYEIYRNEWWTQGRQFDDVMHMVEHSDLAIGCCNENGKLVGFARVLSDFTFKALIFDVIVHCDFRGRGIGKALIDRIIDHQALIKVRSFELYCPEGMVPFYNKLGFAKRSSHLLSFSR
jgi:predicted GNAT family N-acyltransferase